MDFAVRLIEDDPVSGFTLEIEQPLALSRSHELTLLAKALAANPRSVPLRAKFALHQFVQDRFDDAIDTYRSLMADEPRAEWAIMLAECHISKETADDDVLAERFAREAAGIAETPRQKARALASVGKSLRRQGRHAEARESLTSALEAYPAEINAYKRLAAMDLDNGAPNDTIELADSLLAKGVGHSRLLVARALALAKLDRLDEAREAIGLDRFLYRNILTPPAGWSDIAALNAGVRAELARHPDRRFDRYGAASFRTWRIDQPAFDNSSAIPALQRVIRDSVLAHVESLDALETPWTRARPAAGILHNWCVLTDADGFEEWHVHQNGWMSGVYYVDVPPAVLSGHNRAGCIAFGLPPDIVGEGRAREYGEVVVRPEPGLLMLFPSHSYHRTFPHGSEGRRICLAFDIMPG